MPSLKHLNCQFMVEPVLPHRWVVKLADSHDRKAANELGLRETTGKELTDKAEAQRVLDAINNRANQLRNPPRERR